MTIVLDRPKTQVRIPAAGERVLVINHSRYAGLRGVLVAVEPLPCDARGVRFGAVVQLDNGLRPLLGEEHLELGVTW